MKWNFLKKTENFVKSLLTIDEIPVDAEKKKVAFSDEQTEKLTEVLGAEKLKKMISAFEKEMSLLQANDDFLKKIDAELSQMLDTHAEEGAEQSTEDVPLNDRVVGKIDGLSSTLKKQSEMIEKLANEPETKNFEIPEIMKNAIVKHSATHLFGSGKSWDAFDNRPWNARLRDASSKPTDFRNKTNIPTLQEDLEHFVMENPTVLNSMFNDFAELPKEWSHRTGVLDRVADGYIIPTEVVQGRSKGWTPKNEFYIGIEEGRVFAKKIDIEFDGYELQKIETSWLHSYNKEGSHPYKMSFIYFLLKEIIKQQKLDDRKAQTKGIYVKTPEGRAGKAIHSQNGLMYLFYQHRDVEKKYRPFSLGVPTKSNIVDYVNTMIESLPEEERTKEGLEIGISPEKLQWYRKRAGELYQSMAHTDEGKLAYSKDHPIDYPNIIFQPLRDHVKSDFMYITNSKNIEILDYDVNEKGKFTIEHLKRDTYIFADYRLGIRIRQVGLKVAEGGDPTYEKQKVWSNDVPIISEDIKAPLYDDRTGIAKLTYNNIMVDSDFVTDISSIEGIVPGQLLKIYGNSAIAGSPKLKKNTKLKLNSDFNLKSDEVIVLIALADGVFKEVKRSEVTVQSSDAIAFDSDVLDATNGTEFTYTGAEGDLTQIIGGFEGKVITLKTSGEKLTVKTSENVAVSPSYELTGAKFIKLVNVGGTWSEVEKG